jgi:hypothetical protein
MSNCEQMEGLSVLQHGQSVWDYTQKILNKDLTGFRVPEWLTVNFDEILKNIHSRETIELYTVYHDCGKPYCIEFDSDGRKHFPDHAAVSKLTWEKYSSDTAVANLIGWDMVLHTSTADEIEKIKFNITDASTLLIVALAEIHSNAAMFGGIDSISFKSKWKKLNRRGNMLMRLFY